MKQYDQNELKSVAKDSGIHFYSSVEEQELARLKEAINRTPEEKFDFLMNLMKLQRTMQQGSLHHKK